MYVGAYVVVVSYFMLAAISKQATVIPNTWPELARLAVLILLATACYWWGAFTRRTVLVLKPKQDHPDEGFPRGAP